jgi:diguanylate cyclase (GGDEF)-like protein/PAS domain S-box-containing protein
MNKINFKGLRTKMLLALALGMILLFAMLFFPARTVLQDGNAKLEKDKTNIQINSAISLLNEQSSQLSTTVRDNAHWDDLYQYMHKQNPVFIESSFADTTLTNVKVNAILIVSNKGEILVKKSINYRNGKPWRIPELIIQAVRDGGALIDPSKNDQSGLFWTPQGICIVSAFNILDSQERGPRRGTLVMIRLLDEPLLQHIGGILGTKLSVEAMRDDEIAFLSPNLTKGEKAVIPMSGKQVAGFSIIRPIAGDVKLVLGTQSDRKIFEQGQSSLKFLYGALLLIALLLVAFSILLDKLVLRRLAYLNNSVNFIGDSATSAERVLGLSGNDELTSLMQSINGMLDRLDESQLALMFEKERAQVTLAGIADAVITSDNTGRVLYMNTAAERLTGFYSDDAKGKTLQSLFHLMNEDKTASVASNWLTDPASGFDEVVLERDDGASFIITKSASPLHAYNGILFGYVTVLHDVTMLRSLSNQLSYQARHDSLTGLINRYEFDRKTQEAIDDVATENRTHCIAYIDLDQFKVVNDTCGHMAGDQLLQQLADNLKAKVRSADTLARLGGDEFALLLMGCNLKKAQKIVNDMLEVVQSYRFLFDDKVFKVGASIGLAEIFPNQALTLSEVLNIADSACYTAKKDGGNRVYTHRLDDNDMKERHNQLEWVSRIHLALEQQQFVLYIQRMESLGLSQELHCELLIRMQGEDDALYPPGYFLPAAERYHLMPKIDRWVVAEALSIMARKGDDFPYICAINLSGQTLSEEGFLEYVIEQINLHGVDAKRVCFEITETAVIANLNKARHFIHALREIGCRFSLDDFGSGLSSFGYLKNLEVDFLKIDGMFVKAIVNNKIDRAMVESINNVGHVMGLHTIAEFAENDDIINMLKEIGVDYAQGYGVARPELFE